MDIEKKLLKPI